MKQVLALVVFVVVLLAGLSIWYRWSSIGSAPASANSISGEGKSPSPERGDTMAGKIPKPRAPEIASDTWLNSVSLASEDLRGKVVVIEFWTFG